MKLYVFEMVHWLQIVETQQQLMKAKAEEEQKSQVASDARRWNGLKTMVEARALLKSIFKVATNQKAQAGSFLALHEQTSKFIRCH